MTSAAANTGTCPCCFGQFVVKHSVMVLHGYKRPGIGYIIGNCPATRRFKPYEVSSEGTVFMLGLAKDALKARTAFLKKLETFAITEFVVSREKDLKGLTFEQKRRLEKHERYEKITVRQGDGQKQHYYDTQEWYEKERASKVYVTQADIQGIKKDIDFLTKKIKTWTAIDLTAVQAEAAAKKAKEDAALCPGSGTTEHDQSRMRYAYYKGGRCNHCHRFVGASSLGNLRKHPLVEKKEAK